MIEEMKNSVIVEGILSEVDLEKKTYEKDGKMVDCIRGEIKVHVELDGKDLEIPVRFFANKLTKTNNESPAYTNLLNFLETAKSIAAVGKDEADAVRVSGASIMMNEYFTPDNRFVTYPAVRASFINIIKRSDMAYKAVANMAMVINSMAMVTDKDGVEVDPATLRIIGMTVGYNGYTDLVPVITDNPQYISAIQATYNEGDAIEVSAKLYFTSSQVTTYEEVEIGDPIEHTRTVSTSDLKISGVKSSELGTEAYSAAEVNSALASREARIENKKTANAQKKLNERSKSINEAKDNMGF